MDLGSRFSVARNTLLSLTVLLALLVMANAVQASPGVIIGTGASVETGDVSGYMDTVNFSSQYALTDVIRFNLDNGSPDYGIGWGGTGVNAWSFPAGVNNYTLGYGSSNGVTSWFFMGLSTLGNSSGQPSVVLFTNPAFASAVAGKDWGTVFPNTVDQSTMINYLQTMSGTNIWNDLFGFCNGDATNGPYGTVAISPNTSLSIIAFGAPAPVPIPSAFLLLGPGLAGLAVARRRFKK